MEMESCVPPGFRFHPTEEELVGYYLRRKINSLKIDLDVIAEIDLYKMEPWDIEDRCKLGYEEQSEWYFFSYKDKKYPTGTRTNRATTAGFWKATGRDKAVLSKNKVIGMRKTLVFYRGRAPNGRKTDWIMHEYRLQTSDRATPQPQDEGWVVCRAFKKPCPNQRPGYEAWNHAYYARNNHYSDFRPSSIPDTRPGPSFDHQVASVQDLVSNPSLWDNQLTELPQLDSPTLSTSLATTSDFVLRPDSYVPVTEEYDDDERSKNSTSQFIDWKNLDGLFTSTQLNNTTRLVQPSIHLTSTPTSLDHFALETNQTRADQFFLGCFPDKS